jgi:hypothetical protein
VAHVRSSTGASGRVRPALEMRESMTEEAPGVDPELRSGRRTEIRGGDDACAPCGQPTSRPCSAPSHRRADLVATRTTLDAGCHSRVGRPVTNARTRQVPAGVTDRLFVELPPATGPLCRCLGLGRYQWCEHGDAPADVGPATHRSHRDAFPGRGPRGGRRVRGAPARPTEQERPRSGVLRSGPCGWPVRRTSWAR